MKIVWSATALEQLAAIHDYLARHATLFTADRFVQRLITSTDLLEEFPHLGRVVKESSVHRELVSRPYRIVYRATAEEVVVIAVIHGSRDFETALVRSLEELDATGNQIDPDPS